MYDELQGLDVVIAYVLQHGNTNWSSDWRHRPNSAPGLFTERNAAHRAAQLLAHEHSAFFLREVPALCLQSPEGLHIITDYLNPVPFSHIAPPQLATYLQLGEPTSELVHKLTKISGKPATTSLIRMQLDANTPTTPAARKRLTNWSSFRIADESAIHWCDEETDLDRRRIRAIHALFLKVNPPNQVVQQRTLFANDHSDDPADPINREVGRGLQALWKFLSDGDGR